MLADAGPRTGSANESLGTSTTPSGSPSTGQHSLRHWYATEVYRASGGDLLLTQRLLGHASLATIAIYAEPTKDAVEVVALIA